MRALLSTGMVAAAVGLCSLMSALAQPSQQLDHFTLSRKVNQAVGWHWFWSKAAAELAALDKRAVTVKSVRLSDTWVFAISDLGVVVTANVGSDGYPGAFRIDESDSYRDKSTEEIFQVYLKAHYSQSPSTQDCVPIRVTYDKPTATADRQSGPVVPAARPCAIGLAPSILQEHHETVVLDSRSLSVQQVASQHDKLLDSVRKWTREHFPNLSGDVEIPVYSSDDPSIRLYLYSRDRSQRGILTVIRDESPDTWIAWRIHQRKETIEYYRSRIQQRRLFRAGW
jgi:hypothetical protein